MAYQQTKNLEILVTGATGNQGGAIARRLLADGYRVRALVQDAKKESAQKLQTEGARLVEASYDDSESLKKAVENVYGVFLVLPFYTEKWELEIAQGGSVIDAAKNADIKHFVYSSGARANLQTGVPHLDSKGQIEKHLIMSGVPFTIFRPVAFNYSLAGYKESAMQGVLPDARRGDSDVYQIAEEDYAQFVSLAFTDPANWKNQSLDVAGDRLTVAELAKMFGEALGREVKHQQISWKEETESIGEEVVRLMRWVEAEGPRIDVAAIRARYPWLTDLNDYLQTHGWTKDPKQTQTTTN